jgi:hypothetical protein
VRAMPTVRHPITMFVVVVLAVIGIGVGVVAATTNQKVYGPSWGRFSVAFPGLLYGCQTPATVRGASSATVKHTNAGIFSCANVPNGWTGYAPLVNPSELYSVTGVDASGGGAISALLASAVRSDNGFFQARVTQSVQDANGFMVMTLGPQCANGECTEVRVVSKGQVVWELFAMSKGPVSTVERFIASFQPIG